MVYKKSNKFYYCLSSLIFFFCLMIVIIAGYIYINNKIKEKTTPNVNLFPQLIVKETVTSENIIDKTQNFYNNQFTNLLTVLAILITIGGVAIPLAAYLLQRQSLKEEREKIIEDTKKSVEDTITGEISKGLSQQKVDIKLSTKKIAENIEFELTNRMEKFESDLNLTMKGIYEDNKKEKYKNLMELVDNFYNPKDIEKFKTYGDFSNYSLQTILISLANLLYPSTRDIFKEVDEEILFLLRVGKQ
ncbi:hypothetical protein AAEX28_14790 [Lentisphaerota bacterium WC36G]|nr:hypothetical protein LJT99_01545 [Lentisphaerae bacterium WC36]